MNDARAGLAADARVARDVEHFGWHVAKIAGDEKAPPWAFSIGLEQSFGHPEVLVFGMDLELLHGLVNQIGEQVKRGRRFDREGGRADGAPSLLVRAQGVLAGHPPAFRPVAERWHGAFVGNAAWFQRGRSLRVLQCFWPDAEGNLPWEPDFDPAWQGRQPFLFVEDEAAALGADLARVLRDEGAL